MAYPNNAQMQSDLEQRTASTGHALADRAADFAGKAGEQLDKAADSASATLKSMSSSSREAGERVGVVAGNVKSAIDKSVADQPMTTLAVAAALGFVIGAIWKS